MAQDPLLEKLRELPALTPDPALSDRVTRAALTALEDGASLPAKLGFRTFVEFAVYRAAIPSALAGATILYLSWAVTAASHLY